MRVEALQKERSRVVKTLAVIMKLRLSGLFIACVIAEFPVYDLQMQHRGRQWSSFFPGHQIFVGLSGEGRGQKAKLQTAILSDNWNVGLMFGDKYTSVQRDTNFPVQSRCYCRLISKCSWNSWLGKCYHVMFIWIGFLSCIMDQNEYFSLNCCYNVKIIIWVPCLVYSRSVLTSCKQIRHKQMFLN